MTERILYCPTDKGLKAVGRLSMRNKLSLRELGLLAVIAERSLEGIFDCSLSEILSIVTDDENEVREALNALVDKEYIYC